MRTCQRRRPRARLPSDQMPPAHLPAVRPCPFAPRTSSVLTRPWRSRSCWRRFSGTNTARTRPAAAAARIPPADPARGSRDCESDGAAQVVLPAVQRLDRHGGRPLETDQHDAPVSAPISAASAGLTSASRPARVLEVPRPVEAPEAIVDAVDRHARARGARRSDCVTPAFDGDHGQIRERRVRSVALRISPASASRKKPVETTT